MAVLQMLPKTKPLDVKLTFRGEPLTLQLRELTDEETLLDSYETSYCYAQHETSRAFALNLMRRLKLVCVGWEDVVDQGGAKVAFDPMLVVRMLAIDKAFANEAADAISAHLRFEDFDPKKLEPTPPACLPGASSEMPNSVSSTGIASAANAPRLPETSE